MTQLDERYVAHLDILGMKAIVEKNFDLALDSLLSLTEVRDRVLSYEVEFGHTGVRGPARDIVEMVSFSDTIVIFTLNSSRESYLALLILVLYIFQDAFHRSIPMRAGVAYGRFHFDFEKSIFAGPALIEAYQVGEQSQWLGISLADSLLSSRHGVKLRQHGADMFADWDVPLKNGSRRHKVINWPVALQEKLGNGDLLAGSFYRNFEKTFGPFESLGADVQQKYENTVCFINSMIKRIKRLG